MVNYENGQIYKIVCNTSGYIYIGSTAQKKLSVRIGGHRKNYERYCNGKTNFCGSYKIIENDNYIYETLEFYKCDCKRQLEERERIYIEDYKNKYGDKVVNKAIPTRTHKEYYDNNREEILLKKKEYTTIHRERIRQNHLLENLSEEQKLSKKKSRVKYAEKYNKRRRESEEHKLKQQEYRTKHREEINRKARERYLKKKMEA